MGGIGSTMPVYAGLFMVIMLSSVGLPGLNGFVGEFLTLAGAFYAGHTWLVVFGVTGVILAAVYLLWMYQRVVYGIAPGDLARPWPDLNVREVFTLVPVVVMVVWIGLYPSPFLRPMAKTTAHLVDQVRAAQTVPVETVPIVKLSPVWAGEMRQ